MKRYPDSSAGHITGRILLKKLVPVFAALLVTSCGEKSSSEGSESTGESAEPYDDTAKPPVAESPSEEPSGTPKSLSDADVERLLKEAVDYDSLEERDAIFYQGNTPYSGWVKEMYDSGQAEGLARLKDGKPDGLFAMWHENGQKRSEVMFTDGELISEKFWNSKGEEVERP